MTRPARGTSSDFPSCDAPSRAGHRTPDAAGLHPKRRATMRRAWRSRVAQMVGHFVGGAPAESERPPVGVGLICSPGSQRDCSLEPGLNSTQPSHVPAASSSQCHRVIRASGDKSGLRWAITLHMLRVVPTRLTTETTILPQAHVRFHRLSARSGTRCAKARLTRGGCGQDRAGPTKQPKQPKQPKQRWRR